MTEPYTNTPTVRLLTFKEVQNITGLSRSTIYRQMKVRAFPKALLLSERKVGFLQTEPTPFTGQCDITDRSKCNKCSSAKFPNGNWS